jgi:hypothetical protein
MGGGGAVRIFADDPIAPRELAELCAERGWSFAAVPDEKCAFDVVIG